MAINLEEEEIRDGSILISGDSKVSEVPYEKAINLIARTGSFEFGPFCRISEREAGTLYPFHVIEDNGNDTQTILYTRDGERYFRIIQPLTTENRIDKRTKNVRRRTIFGSAVYQNSVSETLIQKELDVIEANLLQKLSAKKTELSVTQNDVYALTGAITKDQARFNLNRPPHTLYTDQPLSARARIEQRTRRHDVFEGMEGASKRFDYLLPRVRQFHILPDQRWDLEKAGKAVFQNENRNAIKLDIRDEEIKGWSAKFDFSNIMFPFEEFSVVIDNNDWVTADHICDERCETNPELHKNMPSISLYKPCGYVVAGSYKEGRWTVIEKFISRNNDRDLHLYVPVAFDWNTGEIGYAFDWNNAQILSSHFSKQVNEEKYRLLVDGVTNFILNFLLALNHRSVRTELIQDPERPINRQQRRATGYMDTLENGEPRSHWKIYIPAVEQLRRRLTEANQPRYMRLKPRYNQEVRGFLRRDKYGRKRIQVKPHRRYTALPDPPTRPEYAAQNLGMEN